MCIPSHAVKSSYWLWRWHGRVSHKSCKVSATVIWHTPRLILITWRARFFLNDPVDDSSTDEDYITVVSFTHVAFKLMSKVLGGLPSILQSMRHSQALSPSYPIETPRFLGMLGKVLLQWLDIMQVVDSQRRSRQRDDRTKKRFSSHVVEAHDTRVCILACSSRADYCFQSVRSLWFQF